jgi:hypothetical protein
MDAKINLGLLKKGVTQERHEWIPTPARWNQKNYGFFSFQRFALECIS